MNYGFIKVQFTLVYFLMLTLQKVIKSWQKNTKDFS